MSVNVHIERLILDGLPANQAQGSIIGAAVETELARLLAAGGLGPSLQSGGAWPSVPAGAIQLVATTPVALGRQIAQGVFQGIGRENQQSRASTSRKE